MTRQRRYALHAIRIQLNEQQLDAIVISITNAYAQLRTNTIPAINITLPTRALDTQEEGPK